MAATPSTAEEENRGWIQQSGKLLMDKFKAIKQEPDKSNKKEKQTHRHGKGDYHGVAVFKP